MQIDWLTVTAQIVNFLVLVWLLQRFLYRPITNAMAQREERIAARLSEARAARAEVTAEAERLRRAQDSLETSRSAILDEARQEAAALRARLEDDIRTEMEGRRKTWQAHLSEERNAITDQLRQRAGHQVIDIVGRILRDYAGSDLATEAAGTFSERLADLDAETRQKLIDAARRATGPARIDSSMTLKPGARSRVTRAIHDTILAGIDVDYHEDDSLILGVRLTIGEQTVEWSAARFLHRLETMLDEVIEDGRHARKMPATARG